MIIFLDIYLKVPDVDLKKELDGLSGKVLGMFFLFHSILYLCIMNMLEQLARIVLPKEILDNFDIV